MIRIFNHTLTLQELLNVDKGREFRSQQVKFNFNKVIYVAEKLTLIKRLIKFFRNDSRGINSIYCYSISGNSGDYVVYIEVPANTNESNLLKSKVKVYCSCSDFMYRSAYILNKKDNLFLNKYTSDKLAKSLRIEPRNVNGGTTTACKHIIAVIPDLKKRLTSSIIK